jgi:hypothetical protein
MREQNRGHLNRSVDKLQNKIYKATKEIINSNPETLHLILVSLLYQDVFYSNRNNPTINDWILELERDHEWRLKQRTGDGEMVKSLFMENITPMVRTKIIDGIRDYMDTSSIKKFQKQINQIGEIIERSYYI